MKPLFTSELLERYKSGEKDFSGVYIRFSDMSNQILKGLTIRDSKLDFVTFRDCSLMDAKFINCEVFFGSFYGGDLTNAIFENCRLELTLFENAVFSNTKIIKSYLSYCGMFNTALGELDMASSSQFKVFTDVSQITESDIEATFARIGPVLGRLDSQVRAKINSIIESDIKRMGLSSPASGASKEYGESRNSPGGPSGYGSQMGDMLDKIIHAYTVQNPYRKASDDEKNKPYKS